MFFFFFPKKIFLNLSVCLSRAPGTQPLQALVWDDQKVWSLKTLLWVSSSELCLPLKSSSYQALETL